VVHDPVVFARWHLGQIEGSDAARSRAIEVRGSGALARALPTWNRRAGPTEQPSTHLELPSAYAVDVGEKKPNRREAVQGELREWQQRFATFIDSATEGRVPAPDLAEALLGLDDLLLRQVDAFAAKDHR
jgi:hypothetical protein